MTKREYEEVERMSIEEVEKLWNTTNIRSMTKSEGAIEMKNKCIQALEKGYRKPWDETSKYTRKQLKYFIITCVYIISIFENNLHENECD